MAIKAEHVDAFKTSNPFSMFKGQWDTDWDKHLNYQGRPTTMDYSHGRLAWPENEMQLQVQEHPIRARGFIYSADPRADLHLLSALRHRRGCHKRLRKVLRVGPDNRCSSFVPIAFGFGLQCRRNRKVTCSSFSIRSPTPRLRDLEPGQSTHAILPRIDAGQAVSSPQVRHDCDRRLCGSPLSSTWDHQISFFLHALHTGRGRVSRRELLNFSTALFGPVVLASPSFRHRRAHTPDVWWPWTISP